MVGDAGIVYTSCEGPRFWCGHVVSWQLVPLDLRVIQVDRTCIVVFGVLHTISSSMLTLFEYLVVILLIWPFCKFSVALLI
jgi:hypothetical protein